MATIAQIKQYITGGFDRVYAYQLTPDGYSLGKAGTALAKGATGSGPYRLLGAKNAQVGIPKPDLQYALGDDGIIGGLLFTPNTLPNFEMAVAVVDQGFDAIIQESIDFDDGNVSFSVLQPTPFNITDIALVFFRRAKSQASATKNASMWSGIVNPKTNMYALGTKDITERKVADNSYYVISNPATTLPDGISLPTNLGVDEAPVSPFSSPNRWIYYAWIGDGMTTTFNIPKSEFKLVGSDITATNLVRVNGTLQLIGLTVNIAVDPQTFTFGSPPADGSHVVARCEVLA